MASQATDPAYIQSEITRGFQQRYGRNPTASELSQWQGYAGRDTYSDRKVREGWNPYLWDRLVTPGSEESSSVDPGDETVVGYEAARPARARMGRASSIPSPVSEPTISSSNGVIDGLLSDYQRQAPRAAMPLILAAKGR